MLLGWKSGVISKIYISPDTAETRSLVKTVDDNVSLAKQFSRLFNTWLRTRVYTDLKPLMELMCVYVGSTR